MICMVLHVVVQGQAKLVPHDLRFVRFVIKVLSRYVQVVLFFLGGLDVKIWTSLLLRF